MTLQQAMLNAERSGLRLFHPRYLSGEMHTLASIQERVVSTMLAIDNEWELEARSITLNEHAVKNRMVPVLRKFIAGGKVDELAEAIVNEFFLEHT